MSGDMNKGPSKDGDLTAVYYSSPWLPDWDQLAVMLLTFDRIVVPFTEIPFGEFDPGIALQKFQKGVARLERGEITLVEENDQIRLNMLRTAALAEHFKGMWDYNVEAQRTLDSKEEIMPIADQLELATRGPRKEGWGPRFTAGLFVRVGEDGDPVARVPGRYYYPAGALAYAAEQDLPLIHDDPEWIALLPPGGEPQPIDTEGLAHRLMIESISCCLPRLRNIGPYEILEIRAQTRDLVAPFRAEMRRLAHDLRMRLSSAEDVADIQLEVAEHVKYVVLPLVAETRRQLSEPTKPWYRWIQDPLETALTVGIASSQLTNPVITGLLSGAWRLSMDLSDAQKIRMKQKSSALYYLIKATGG